MDAWLDKTLRNLPGVIASHPKETILWMCGIFLVFYFQVWVNRFKVDPKEKALAEELEDPWPEEEEAEAVEGLRKEPPPRAWLVPYLVPCGPAPLWKPTLRNWLRKVYKGYITMIAGMRGTGKSYILLYLCIAMLAEKMWFDLAVAKCKRILYVDCELDSQTFWQRSYAISRGLGLEKPPGGLRYLRLYASLATPAGIRKVKREALRHKAQMIAIDSATIGAWGAALSDNNIWRKIYTELEKIGIPIVIIDHLGKDPSKGAAGTFAKEALIRSGIILDKEISGVSFTQSKSNFDEEYPVFFYKVDFQSSPLTASFSRIHASPPADEDVIPFEIHLPPRKERPLSEIPTPSPLAGEATPVGDVGEEGLAEQLLGG